MPRRLLIRLIPALLSALLAAGCVVNIPIPGPVPARFVVVSGEGVPFVYMLRIDGMISDASQRTGIFPSQIQPGMVESVRIQLDTLERQQVQPVALLLRINSPGGTITASDIVYHQLLSYKRRHKIPVVVLMMDVAASGGYYVAMAGDTLVAHPTSLTGSLGVLLPSFNISGLMKRYGVEDTSVKSGPYKDLLSMTRPRPAEHDAVLQGLVDSMHKRFMAVVKEGRGSKLRRPVAELADGRVYSAEQARQVGLIDQVGYFEDAVQELRKLTGLAEFRIVTLAALHDTDQGNIYMRQPLAPPSTPWSATGAPPWILPFLPAPSYLWLPAWQGAQPR